jgi:hypothetical protein
MRAEKHVFLHVGSFIYAPMLTKTGTSQQAFAALCSIRFHDNPYSSFPVLHAGGHGQANFRS